MHSTSIGITIDPRPLQARLLEVAASLHDTAAETERHEIAVLHAAIELRDARARLAGGRAYVARRAAEVLCAELRLEAVRHARRVSAPSQ